MPLVASLPLQAFEAVQNVALVELHVNVAEPPEATADALRFKLAVGSTVPETVTVAVAGLLVPAGPVQLIAYD